jgi:hypothetical protein
LYVTCGTAPFGVVCAPLRDARIAASAGFLASTLLLRQHASAGCYLLCHHIVEAKHRYPKRGRLRSGRSRSAQLRQRPVPTPRCCRRESRGGPVCLPDGWRYAVAGASAPRGCQQRKDAAARYRWSSTQYRNFDYHAQLQAASWIDQLLPTEGGSSPASMQCPFARSHHVERKTDAGAQKPFHGGDDVAADRRSTSSGASS